MIEGAYNISATTPFGTKTGVAYLVEKDGKVGIKATMDVGTIVLAGTVDEDTDTFAVHGVTTRGVGGIPEDLAFRLIGSVVGDVLSAQFITDRAAYRIRGSRVRS